MRTSSDAEYTLFIDENGSVKDGKCQAEYAVVTMEDVLLAGHLPQTWSAHWAELWALIQALNWANKKEVNIYVDLRYAFAKIHVH